MDYSAKVNKKISQLSQASAKEFASEPTLVTKAQFMIEFRRHHLDQNIDLDFLDDGIGNAIALAISQDLADLNESGVRKFSDVLEKWCVTVECSQEFAHLSTHNFRTGRLPNYPVEFASESYVDENVRDVLLHIINRVTDKVFKPDEFDMSFVNKLNIGQGSLVEIILEAENIFDVMFSNDDVQAISTSKSMCLSELVDVLLDMIFLKA
jgi:hypothetical protein